MKILTALLIITLCMVSGCGYQIISTEDLEIIKEEASLVPDANDTPEIIEGKVEQFEITKKAEQTKEEFKFWGVYMVACIGLCIAGAILLFLGSSKMGIALLGGGAVGFGLIQAFRVQWIGIAVGAVALAGVGFMLWETWSKGRSLKELAQNTTLTSAKHMSKPTQKFIDKVTV